VLKHRLVAFSGREVGASLGALPGVNCLMKVLGMMRGIAGGHEVHQRLE
jgi:hypothetical protein